MSGRPAIIAIGCAVPPHRMLQDDIAAFMVAVHGFEGRDARRLRELYRLTRIDVRHSVIADYGRAPESFRFFPPNPRLEPAPGTARRMELFEREALPLAAEAAGEALDRAGMSPGNVLTRGDIEHVIVVSCTGSFAPGLDSALVDLLGLREDVGRTLVGFQGCHAGLAALRLAADLAIARPEGAVLIVCVELSTLHFQLEPSDENLLANALFADGAAAVVVAGAELVRRAAAHGGASPRFEITASRTVLRSAGREAMVWTIGDTGFRLRLSSLLPRLIALDLRTALAPLLASRDGDGAREPDFWAVHPGGSAILHAVERALELSPQALGASREVLRGYGNMSSPTVFFVLREILARGAAPGTEGIALAFGPGLTIEASRLTRC